MSIKVFGVIAAVVLSATTAFAADLPSRKYAPPAPVVERPAHMPFFIGLNAGGTTKTENGTVGAVAGYEFNQYFRAEGTYDHYFGKSVPFGPNIVEDAVALNGVVSYPFGAFSPYALAGVGYRWSDVANEGIYNVGLGARYALTERVELDGRYRFISNFDNNRTDNVFTVGMNVKF